MSIYIGWAASVQLTTGSRGVRISGNNAGYTMFRGSVKGTGYPHHSPVSPSLPLPCATVCHRISTEHYHEMAKDVKNISSHLTDNMVEYSRFLLHIRNLSRKILVQYNTKVISTSSQIRLNSPLTL